ncbi:MAG: hypothetical protein Ta2A_02580 [Treponemataceae bacterium]|nr:MAG: hypothetical protein Ta2A_02580 [Treponemataceae bacterium]
MDTLDKAKKMMRQRRFADAVSLLERNILADDNRRTFDYLYALSVSSMYIGDFGNAEEYLDHAAKLSKLDVRLDLAYALIHLRRGETDKAVEYYLDAKQKEGASKQADKALNFIRKHSKPETLSRSIRSNKIKQFYPKVGIDTTPILATVFALLIIGGAAIFVFRAIHNKPDFYAGGRADLSALSLTSTEKESAASSNASEVMYRYLLTQDEILETYKKAREYFQNYRDNAAQIEINKILNSNASAAVRQKARALMPFFAEPTFDSLKDNLQYTEVAKNLPLYIDCYVIWPGRIVNIAPNETADETPLRCDFLPGDGSLNTVFDIVPLVFDSPVQTIDPEKTVRLLAKISVADDGKTLILKGKNIYQPMQ